jgi:hypothetical protein
MASIVHVDGPGGAGGAGGAGGPGGAGITAMPVTVEPETLHTEGVVEIKLTARPELAVALTVNVAVGERYEVMAELNVIA